MPAERRTAIGSARHAPYGQAANRLKESLFGSMTVSMRRIYEDTLEYWDHRVDAIVEHIRRLYAGENDDTANAPPDDTAYPGVQRLNRIIENFMMCMPRWEIYQIRVFSGSLCTFLPLILGEDGDMCLDWIMQKYKWERQYEEVFCIMPRGSGKSTCIGAVVASLMVEIPHFSAVLYSMTEDKAKDLLKSFHDAFNVLDSYGRVPNSPKKKLSSRKVTVHGDADVNDVRWIASVSALGAVRICMFVCSVVTTAAAIFFGIFGQLQSRIIFRVRAHFFRTY